MDLVDVNTLRQYSWYRYAGPDGEPNQVGRAIYLDRDFDFSTGIMKDFLKVAVPAGKTKAVKIESWPIEHVGENLANHASPHHANLPRKAWRVGCDESGAPREDVVDPWVERFGSCEGPNQTNYSDRSSVRILGIERKPRKTTSSRSEFFQNSGTLNFR